VPTVIKITLEKNTLVIDGAPKDCRERKYATTATSRTKKWLGI
jgi:hypothetical protein